MATLKADLIQRKEVTALCVQERGNSFAARLDNLDQTVFGEPAYPSVKSKGTLIRLVMNLLVPKVVE